MNISASFFLNYSVIGSVIRNTSAGTQGPLESTLTSRWTSLITFNLVTEAVALFMNLFLVGLFVRDKNVQTSFNVYITNLCVVNIGYILQHFPITLFNEWTPYVYKAKGFCVFQRTLSRTFGALIVHSHFLIAMNRLWAVTSPVTYRNYHRLHSVIRPALVCLVLWVWVIIVSGIPGIVFDIWRPHTITESVHCFPGSVNPPYWQRTTQLVVNDIPILITLLVYPYICYKTWTNLRVRPLTVDTQPPTVRTGDDTATATEQSVKPVNPPVEPSQRQKRAVRIGQQFFTLSLLVLNVAVLQLPTQVFHTLLTFGLSSFGSPMVRVVTVLYSLTSVLDPIMFLVSIKTFRHAVKTCVK